MTNHELLEARAQIARLQRRVERERSARRESEEVAERSLRRLYARQRALDLLTRSAAASNSASDDQAAFTEVMTMLVGLCSTASESLRMVASSARRREMSRSTPT